MISNLIGQLAFRDLFGIDISSHTQINGSRNLHHNKLDVPNEDDLNIIHANIFMKHINFLNALIHTAYGKLEKSEEDFPTKKAFKAYKTT